MITTRLDSVNDADINKNGLAALRDALGVTGVFKIGILCIDILSNGE